MSRAIPFLFLAFLILTGCETRKQADLRARQAYLVGQQQGLRQWQSQQPPEVIVHGPVRNPTVQWADGLTLSKAIVAADYTGFMNPIVIRVIRKGRMIDEAKGVDLLRGHDVPLEPGDFIDIVP